MYDGLLAALGLRRGDTVDSTLSRNRGVGPGFGWLRILLAVVIFYSHAKYIVGSASRHGAAALAPVIAGGTHGTPTALLAAEGGWTGWHRPIAVALVPVFFALSGFLVTGSALRLRRTSTFLAARAMRIFPALTAEVTLSALILGPALTILPLSAYFTDPEFSSYFSNILGIVRYRLPGLFLDNPAKGTVNLNLWTLPGEFYCYLAMAACMVVGIVYKRSAFTMILVAATLILAPLNLFTDFDVVAAALPTHALTFYFLVGVAFYHWRDRIPLDPLLFVASSAIGFCLLLSKHTVYIAPPFVVYSTVFFGMVRLPKSRLIESGDYSYGIYLYGFPISQAVMVLLPVLRGHVWWLMLIAGTLTALFAVASWHLLEKHALKLKKHLPARFFPAAPRVLSAVPSKELRV